MAGLDNGAVDEQLQSCFGVSSVDLVTLETINARDPEYAQCLNQTGIVNFDFEIFLGVPIVQTSSPCGGDPGAASGDCCAAISRAQDCELAAGSTLITDECKGLLDNVVFGTYECEDSLGVALLALLLGVLALMFFGGALCMRRTPVGALLRKNLLLWKQRAVGMFVAQALSVGLLGALAAILLEFTGERTETYNLALLNIDFILRTPDANRTLIYTNLRPFGGLFVMIVFTYAVANMTVSLVAEKETRMKEAMRMAGMRDMTLIASWVLTFLVQYAPTAVGTAVVTHFGFIFPNQTVYELSFFFLAFLFAMAGFGFLTAVFFSRTRPAAVASVCALYLLLFASFYFLSTGDLAEQRDGCLIAPVCLALGVNTMLDDASLGSGFARAAAIFSTNRTELLLQPTECALWMLLDGFLYLLAAWYLDKVLPQEFGVRRRPDFVLQPVYPYVMRAVRYVRARYAAWRDARAGVKVEAQDAAGEASASGSASRPPSAPSSDDDGDVAEAQRRGVKQDPGELDEDGVLLPDTGLLEGGDEEGDEWEAAQTARRVQSEIVVSHLSKHFRITGMREVRRAVNDLSLTLEKDSITAVLGPNGAGKTTTFGILTGLVEPTSGDVVVFGHSVRTEMHKIRGRMGVCPQHNIVYPTLTVLQHLELFAALRGKRLDMSATQEMLRELAMWKKRHTQARNLSGGQQRKLCLVMALTGDTDLVILDEVTAGVDPTSRRACWNVIQNNRRGRAILMATHHLEEADILGDKIIILANGALCCEGTSLDLKRRYGSGYRLAVGLGDGAADARKVSQTVLAEVPTAQLLQRGGSSRMSVSADSGAGELEFTLPFAEISAFPKLLRLLEHQLKCSVSVSITTLEEVFLKVAAQHTDDAVSLDHLSQVPPYVEKRALRPRAFWALLVKRVRYAMRDSRAGVLVVLLPIVFCCALLLVPNIQLYGLIFPGDGVSAPRNEACEARIPAGSLGWASTDGIPVTYPLSANTPVTTAGRTCCPQPDRAFSSAVEQLKFRQCVEVLPQCAGVSDAADAQRNCYERQFSFCYAVPWLCKVEECCDPRNARSPFYLCQSVAALDPAVLFDPAQANLNNFCNEREFTIAQEFVNSFIRTIILLLGFAFPAASVVAFAVMEREPERDTKFQQMVNGVGTFVFWAAAFVFDQATVVLPVVAVPVVLAALDTSSLNHDAGVVAQAVFLTLAFVFACVPLAYAASFSYTEHARALIGMLVFQIVTGGALSTLAYVLSVVPLSVGGVSTVDIVEDYVRYVLSVLPGYAYADALLRLQVQLVRRCATFLPERNVADCTDLYQLVESVPTGVDGPALAQIRARLGFVDSRDLSARVALPIEDTVVSIAFMVGTAVACWLYVGVRETNVFKTWLCCSCLRRDSVVRRHRRAAARSPGRDDDDVAEAVLVDVAELDDDMEDVELATRIAVAQEVSLDLLRRGKAAEREMRRQASYQNRLIEQGATDVLMERERVQQQTDDAVQFLGTTKRYPGKLALDDLWLGVQRECIFGYLGANGAGKSTTIKVLTGAESPSSGSATVLGKSVRTQLAAARRSLGYCPQHDALYDLLTVREHLVMYARIRGLSNVRAAVESSVTRMQLTRFEHVVAKQLSGGNKRKLSAAIALLNAGVVVLDEPSSGVDPLSQRYLWEVIRDSVKHTRAAVLLVSHSMPEVEALASRIGVLIDGRLRCIGSAHYLKSLYGSSYSVEINLAVDDTRLLEPAVLVDGYVYPANLAAVCEALGVPARREQLQPTGQAASSPVAFALNSPSIGRVLWRDFQRWWVQEDAAARVTSLLEERWAVGPGSSVVLTDRHGPYMLFRVANAELQVADMFELLEFSQGEYGLEHYSVSMTGLEEIFHSVVENTSSSEDL